MKLWLLLAIAACSAAPATGHPVAAVAAVAPPSAPHYLLPDALAAALAKEPLSGVVLVSSRFALQSTAARARTAVASDAYGMVSMTVVEDHGAVVAVRTDRSVDDCVRGFELEFELTGFVPRAALVARAPQQIAKQFADGTGYAIDRGAPISVTATGLAWSDPLLRATGAPIPETLRYTLASPYAPATLSEDLGARMVCGTVEGHEDYPEPKYCGIAPDATPTLDGHPFELTYDAYTRGVYHHGATLLADIATTCGSLRVQLDPRAAQDVGVGGVAGRCSPARTSAICTQSHGRIFTPKPGPVTWPDRTRAGKFVGRWGDYQERDIVEVGDAYCVAVDGVAERVCHAKADVTVR
jgi:hypothetical protein